MEKLKQIGHCHAADYRKVIDLKAASELAHYRASLASHGETSLFEISRLEQIRQR